MSILPKTRLNNFLVSFLITVSIATFLTIIFTWPMILNLSNWYSDKSDYALIGWIFWYNESSLTSGRIFSPTNYFNSFQFYPWPYSLAYSEFLLLPSLIMSPVYFLTHQLVLTVNLYVFFTFVFSFISSYYVFKYFIKNYLTTFLASAIFTFNPLTASHFPSHAHLLGKFFLPPIFLFSFLLFSKPSIKRALLLGLFFSLNAFTSINLLTISVPVVALTAIPFIWLHKNDFTYWKNLFISSLICLIFAPILFFFLTPYIDFSTSENIRRTLQETISFSAKPLDYLLVTPDNWLLGDWVKRFDNIRFSVDGINYSEHTLGLNFITFGLFIFGLINLKSLKNSLSSVVILFVFFGSLILSFGPFIEGIKLPYYYVNALFGIFNGIRVPSRFEFALYIPIAVISGIGFNKLTSSKKIYSVLFFLFLTILMIENFIPRDTSETSILTSSDPQITTYRQLRFLDNSKTVHIPTFVGSWDKQIYYLNLATFHSENIMNGYSGYFPPDWIDFLAKVESEFDLNTLKKLKALNLDYVIIHKLDTPQQFLKKLDQLTIKHDLTVYNDPDYLILGLASPYLEVKKCLFARDIKLTLLPFNNSFGFTPTFYQQLKLSNKTNCFWTNPFQNRYQSININLNQYQMNLKTKLPMVVSPNEEFFVR